MFDFSRFEERTYNNIWVIAIFMFILKLPSQNIKWALNLTPIRNVYEFRKYTSANNDNLRQKIGLRHQKETVQTLIKLNILTWKTRMSNSLQLRIFQNVHTHESY
jgi:hypothetical protein